jgi:hypothetical protein
MTTLLDDFYPQGWPRCTCGLPVMDGHLTCGKLECDEAGARARLDAAYAAGQLLVRRARMQVGDLVIVGRASGVNASLALGVVVEVYELDGRRGWTILFEDGRHDGFSPEDCALFEVTPIGHNADVASYVFTSAMRLYSDWHAGRFAAVWR